MKKTKYKQKTNKLFYIAIIIFVILISFTFMFLKNKTSFFSDIFYKSIVFCKSNQNINKNINNKIYETENKILKEEIKILKKQLELKNLYTNYKIINATVINRNKTYWFNDLTIDKGKKDGIEKDMAVITINGLIGKIIEVYDNTSTIKLITNNDNNNKISVSVEGEKGVKNGITSSYNSNTNYIEVTGFTSYDDIKINSIVKTTGLGIFPKGLEIGKVIEIKKDNYNISKILYVEPNQNMNEINYVTVIGNTIND